MRPWGSAWGHPAARSLQPYAAPPSSPAQLSIPQALRSAAGNWVEAAAAPWDVLRDLCTAVRAARPGASGPWLHELCAGGGLDLPAPPPRARTKTPQLEAHLEQLRRKLEQDAYDRMVRDVTEKASRRWVQGFLRAAWGRQGRAALAAAVRTGQRGWGEYKDGRNNAQIRLSWPQRTRADARLI